MSSLFYAFEDCFSASDDASYAEELQLQEVVEASLNFSTISLDDPSSSNHVASTSSLRISCEICTEDKEKSDMYQVEGCTHSYCTTCICKHIEYKLQEREIHISCPDEDCDTIIEPGSVRSIVPPDVLDRWNEAVIESTIRDSQKVYCPYENCSEMLVLDDDEATIIRESECPWCRRSFCARCRVPWHRGYGCKEFQRSENRKEKKLRLLARRNKWTKCPNCKVYVDKTHGCIHITCRCKFEFCYACGSSWNETHWGSCQE